MTGPPPPGQDRPAPGEDLEKRILQASGWLALSLGGGALLWLLAVLVLARLLTPADFGLVSLAAAVLIFLEPVQSGGIRTALIQRRTGIEQAAASAFLFGLVVSVVLYGALFAAAPLFASFFHAPRLDEVMRVIGVVVLIGGVALVPAALLERELAFRRRAVVEISSIVVQCALSIGLAVAGYGVWSLVWGQIARALTVCVLAWALTPSRPLLRHRSWPVLRELVRFARFVTAGRFAELAIGTVDNFMVGRILGTASVGFYAIAFRLATVPSSLFAVIGNVVMLPALSLVHDDPVAFKKAFIANLQRLAFVSLPFCAILVVGADPIVEALLGSTWEAVVDPLRLLAVYSLVRALMTTALPAFEASGRPGLTLLTVIPNAVTLLPILYFLTSWYGTAGAAAGMVLSLLTSAIPAAVISGRVLRIRFRELATALAGPVVSCALLAAALVGLLQASAGLGARASAALLVVGGAAAYLAAASVFARGILIPVVQTYRSALTGRRAAPAVVGGETLDYDPK